MFPLLIHVLNNLGADIIPQTAVLTEAPVDMAAVAPAQAPAPAPAPRAPPQTSDMGFVKWSQEEVQEWVARSNLEKYDHYCLKIH